MEPRRPAPFTDLSAWLVSRRSQGSGGATLDKAGGERHRGSQRLRSTEELRLEKESQLEKALQYFKTIPDYTPYKGNLTMKKHLDVIQSVAFDKGLLPEAVEILLNVAMSSKLADSVNVPLLKCLIPAFDVPENAVVHAVSWMCTAKPSARSKAMFLRWLITVFDLIDHKEQIHALHGIFFCFLQDEKLCPYICHVLYLLTVKESVKPFRVRRLLDLQSRKGKQPYLQALLALYKVFCPELVSLSLPTNLKTYFKNVDKTWKTTISAVQLKNKRQQSLVQQPHSTLAQMASRKRKWNSNKNPPLRSTVAELDSRTSSFLSKRETVPVEQLRTFFDLLQNIHRLEFPAQMGSVLNSPLMLHYLSCVKDESALLRLNFWLGNVLEEEFPWNTTEQNEQEFMEFLNTLCRAQEFLQEGFSSTEKFLYRCLQRWDGSCCRSQILSLLSWLPIITVSEMKTLLFEPLKKLFFTSSVYFKCSVLESLNDLLLNWLTRHSVYSSEMDVDLDSSSQSFQNINLSMLVNSVVELVRFVGQLSSISLMMEDYNILLMYFILCIFETVSDMYLKYNFPLVLLPPAGVFYPALLSTECVSVNQLCFIMCRYRANLIAAKETELNKKLPLGFTVSSKTFREYNQYVSVMVECLWSSDPFSKDSHPLGIWMNPELLEQTKVPEYRKSLNIVYHPAFIGHAINFLQQGWPEDRSLDLSSIKGKKWNWYVEYLYSQGLDGLKLFIESSIKRRT